MRLKKKKNHKGVQYPLACFCDRIFLYSLMKIKKKKKELFLAEDCLVIVHNITLVDHIWVFIF